MATSLYIFFLKLVKIYVVVIVTKDKAYTHEKEYYYSIIRKNIKKLRKEKGYTQQDLADMTELSREYICDIENEKRGKHLTIEVLGRISEALGTEIYKFFEE